MFGQLVPMVSVRKATFPQDETEVLSIWREFVASPSVDLGFQGYEDEFANLPGKYGAPTGCLLLGTVVGSVQGCVGFRRVNTEICEMKRLYVRPSARGHGLGRRLVEDLIAEARNAGYGEIRLDVLAEFEAARKLYTDMGFEPAEPVSHNPLADTTFLGLRIP